MALNRLFNFGIPSSLYALTGEPKVPPRNKSPAQSHMWRKKKPQASGTVVICRANREPPA
jgi:hypothetical protein